MVSSLRYSYPAFIPLILGTFLLAAQYDAAELLGYIAVGNMLMVTSLAYYPKLVLAYVPLALILNRLLYRYDLTEGKRVPSCSYAVATATRMC
jgi:hypothetical protein